ncbi:hypothetical protein HY933_01365 [Candidatus Falkowbacteria bacterium]|nr:hypothetical protein [Candidatus Falkowbacteria bacterium]
MPTCKQCTTDFPITDADKTFYAKMDVPAPTWCPACRHQRRLAWRNERTLYQRQCDFSGRPTISAFSPDSGLVVYDQRDWWGDGWDPLEYGREFDFSRPFFEQFQQLQQVVPHFSLYNINPVNSDYINFGIDNKNVYLGFSSVRCEDCYYCANITDVRDCVDCLFTHDRSELCYETVDVNDCYHGSYLQECDGLTDCAFCYDCRGCTECFGCVNLRNRQHCWFNEQLSEREYRLRRSQLDLGSYTVVEQLKEKFKQHCLSQPHRFAVLTKSVDCNGDHLYNSKNLQSCFDCLGCEDGVYCYRAMNAKDIRDCYGLLDSELIYESMASAQHNVAFSVQSYFDEHIRYCDLCFSCTHCFGCISLRHKQYCLLNKQYTEAEYRQLVPKIVEHMKTTGEWGQFFPAALSPFGYNETLAMEEFPLSQETALAKGFRWNDNLPFSSGQETMKPGDLPDHIKDVPDSIVSEVLLCMQCNKNYKIIPQELKFYRQQGLALPRRCFSCRHANRLHLRNPRRLYPRQCMCEQVGHQHIGRCSVEFETTYAPDRPERVYCEECYQKEIY